MRKSRQTHEVKVGPDKSAVVKPRGTVRKTRKPPLFHPKALTELANLEGLDNEAVELRIGHARKIAASEFITDSDQHTISWHHGREDRPWNTLISMRGFQGWAASDSWLDKREAFWNEVETKLLHARAEQLAIQRLREIDEMSSARDYMQEYMVPLRDSHGDVMRYPETTKDGDRHEFAGLPRYPLELPRMDQFVRMFLDLDKQLMLKRGEVTERTQNVDKQLEPIDPVANSLSFSREDLQAMARLLLHKRQPELVETTGEETDVAEDTGLDQTGDA